MESGSPMSFKLPVKVINKYKDKLEKKSSFKKTLTEEIKKMCNFLKNINNYSFIINKVEELEKETNINKRYVVTEVDPESSKTLKDFRSKHDITQSALLWLWIENNGELKNNIGNKETISNNTNNIIKEEVKKENLINETKKDKIKTIPINKVEKGSVSSNESQEDNLNTKYIETNLSNTSSLNKKKIEKLLNLNEYDGPTEEIILELPASTINNFKINLKEGISLEKAIQEEIRKMCKIVKLSKSKSLIVNHVKRIEKYKTENIKVKLKIDPDSKNILELFYNNYGVSKSGLIWLWLSMDSLKYNIFKLVD